MRVQGSGYWSPCSPGRADASGCSPRWRALLRCIISGRCKLLRRIRGVIKDRFADPDFGPCDVAAEAGISLRYVQKLFTERGSTCSGDFNKARTISHAETFIQIALRTDASVFESSSASAAAMPKWQRIRAQRNTIGDAQAALSLIVAGTANGTILSDEAATLASIVSSFVKTVEVAEIETRLVALEQASAGATSGSATGARFDA
jgi:hypothetical protein